MKKKETYNGTYRHFIAQFQSNLKTLNYSNGTIKSSITSTIEYLEHLEQHKTKLIDSNSKDLKDYFSYLEARTNKNTGVGLKLSYLQKIKYGLSLFYEFLYLTQEVKYNSVVFPRISNSKYIPNVLSIDDVKRLFKVCDQSLLGQRNKALLALYYGCGLRRQEGINLNVDQLDFSKGTVFISKSKTHNQRSVPMSTNIQLILENYSYNVREKLIDKELSESAFMVTERGKRLTVESVSYILKKLVKEAKISVKTSPHTLRHSIATHLLHSGMKLEYISLFLGHKSMDSTQIYTQLINIKQ